MPDLREYLSCLLHQSDLKVLDVAILLTVLLFLTPAFCNWQSV